jgi:hypothetical protein
LRPENLSPLATAVPRAASVARGAKRPRAAAGALAGCGKTNVPVAGKVAAAGCSVADVPPILLD